ncbi:hypothetical protein P154DRAFT_614838 [Amniculicola lignicola CBS 123094]|uniref:GST N-terminal domain-containing protein n=1 Tax=Amniculicola lignicola CBS 123094 TaxID=1392246 RepID=A0A6A5X3L4_9PLEO|nr:hypothetical protein P154DRAFT_614838 [Amniculicola lignicola CBS 123094]
MSPNQKPVLFHYPPSIYSHRVLWYLWLRGLPYDECIQPAYMPRPDLAALGVNYRRIPIMAIGKDVYCDSRLIINKLEELYPNSNVSLPSSSDKGIRKLLESWTIDGGIFTNATRLMPYWTSTGLLSNTAFLDDRQTLMGGRRMTAAAMERGRPDALIHIRQAFEMVENTFLADGRKWILGTDGPTIADIDGVWPFEWLVADRAMKESLPEQYVSASKYPKTYAWVQRLLNEVQARKARQPKPERLGGSAVESMTESTSAQPESTTIISDDPLGLSEGDAVEVYPTDYGFTHKDHGSIIGLTSNEVVILNSKGLHLHFPRWNFHVEKIKVASSAPRSITQAPKISKMRLLYHPGSPFARKVFMTALEHGLEQFITLEKAVVCPVPFPGWSDNVEDVAVFNPMAKIPCLIPENVPDGIFDSRIICEYLESLTSVPPKNNTRHWELRALHACADGIMDAGVLQVYEKRIREPKGLRLDAWMEGQKSKMIRGLDRFETAVKSGLLRDSPSGPALADELAVVAAITFSDQMGIKWRDTRPDLVGWFAKWEQRKSFQLSPPTGGWKASGNVKAGSKI